MFFHIFFLTYGCQAWKLLTESCTAWDYSFPYTPAVRSPWANNFPHETVENTETRGFGAVWWTDGNMCHGGFNSRKRMVIRTRLSFGWVHEHASNIINHHTKTSISYEPHLTMLTSRTSSHLLPGHVISQAFLVQAWIQACDIHKMQVLLLGFRFQRSQFGGGRHENSWNLTWMYLATQAVLTDGAWWCFRSQLKQSSPKENERCCGEDERHMQHVTCLKAAEVVKIQAFLVFSFFTVLHSAETIFMNNWASNPASGLQASATGHTNHETVKYIFAWQRNVCSGRFHSDRRVDTLEWVERVGVSVTICQERLWKLPKLINEKDGSANQPGWKFRPARYKREWSSWLSPHKYGFNL